MQPADPDPTPSFRPALVLLACLCWLAAACSQGAAQELTPGLGGKRLPVETQAQVQEALSAAFRIDVSTLDVTLDVFPKRKRIQGHALLKFRMRPGQSKALFHFAPPTKKGTARDTLQEIVLDGRPVLLAGDSQLKLVQPSGSEELAFEIQRSLAADTEHELSIRWTAKRCKPLFEHGGLRTTVDDTEGDGNESLWPTINSPEELARHRFQLRIHDEREFVVTASGSVRHILGDLASQTAGPQTFLIDSGRKISSYTMMLVALPLENVWVQRFETAGIPVTLLSTTRKRDAREARAIIEETLPELVQDFGPYPAPFLNVLLSDWDDGMEYYGATISGVDSLRHELAHMYWGCSAVGRTWRDTWLDEALTVWWTERENLEPLPPDFSSAMLSSRTPTQLAFDERGYEEGARLIANTAQKLGGDQALIEFLKELHARRQFQPFSTGQFVNDLVAASGQENFVDLYTRCLCTPAEENSD